MQWKQSERLTAPQKPQILEYLEQILDQANVNRFDNAAANWNSNPQVQLRAEKMIEKISQEVSLSPVLNILDYGCGTGTLTVLLAERAGKVTAVDSSAGMLDVLKQRIEQQQINNISIVNCDYSDKMFAELGEFDIAVSVMTLHHIREPEKFATAVYDAVKPGGCIIVGDLDEEDGSFHEDKTGVYHSGFRAEQLKEILASAGFTDIRIEKAYTMVKFDKEFPVLMAIGVKR